MEEVPLCEDHLDRTCHLDDGDELACVACDANRFLGALNEAMDCANEKALGWERVLRRILREAINR